MSNPMSEFWQQNGPNPVPQEEYDMPDGFDRYAVAYKLLDDRLHAGHKGKDVQDDLRAWETDAEAFALAFALRTEFDDPADFWPVWSNDRWLRMNPDRSAEQQRVARPRTHEEAMRNATTPD